MHATEHRQIEGESATGTDETSATPAPRGPGMAYAGAVPPVASLFGKVASAIGKTFSTASEQAYGSIMGSDGPPVHHESPEVTNARELLMALDPSYSDKDAGRNLAGDDQERLLDLIRRILDRARHESDPEIARGLLDVIRRYGLANKYPMVAEAIATVEHELQHRAPATTTPASAPKATAGLTASPGGFDWSSLIVHDKSGTHAAATITPADQAKLAAIAAGRPGKIAVARAALGQRLHSKVSYQGKADAGWMHSGSTAGMTVPTGGDPMLEAAANELFLGGKKGTSIEASASGVVTYDGTLSVGSGWANGAAADYVGRWLDKDPSARELLLEAGFTITADRRWAVIDTTGNILVGEAARQYLRNEPDGGILDYISGLIEDPAHAPLAMAAQTEKLKQETTDQIKEPLRTEMKGWTPEQLGAAFHLGHWLPAGGPVYNPKDFTRSKGDPLMMISAFAANLKFIHKPNGAYVFGQDINTAQPYDGHFDRFGDGLFKTALEPYVKTPVSMTFAEASGDSRFAGRVLMVLGKPKPDSDKVQMFIDLGPLWSPTP